MPKQIIAVDMDDVVVETATGVVEYYAKKYGVEIPLKDFYSKDFKNVWKTPDGATAVRRVNEYLESSEYHNSAPAREAIETIRWLQERYELHIVTGRPSLVEEATERWLQHHYLDIFESIVFTNAFMYGDDSVAMRTKGDVCLELGATILIDDNLEHARSVSDAGLQVLLFGTYPWNETDELPDSIHRVQNWHEVKAYFEERG